MESTTKPGWKTTEFWITLLVTLISALLASGALSDADPTQHKILQAIGMISALLASMGYTAVRGFTKASDSKAAVISSLASAAAEGAKAGNPS